MVFLSSFLAMVIAFTFSQMEVSGKLYTPQVQVFVEKSAVTRWKELSGYTDTTLIKDEITSMFVNINEYFKGLMFRGNLNFQFGVQSIDILDKDVIKDDEIKGQLTNDTKSMDIFENYIYPSYKSNPYDVAIIFTGHKLNFGVAATYIGLICTKSGIVLSTMSATGRDILVLAHELAHTIGALHDVSKVTTDPCYYKGGYLMVPNAKYSLWSPLRFNFSECSYNEITAHLDGLENERKDCLKDDSDNVATGTMFGSIVTPDNLCRRSALGKDYFLDRSQYDGPDEVCVALRCTGKDGLVNSSTAQGAPCGKNKVCRRGKCVEDPTGSPFTVDKCPFGDQPKIGHSFDKTCTNLQSSECAAYKKYCCLSCDNSNPMFSMTADEACKVMYGSNSVFARNHYESYGDRFCARMTCTSNKVGERLAYKHTKTPDGLACGNNKRCLSGKCEATNHGNPKITSDTCPFGDQTISDLNPGDTDTCTQVAASGRCKALGGTCCASCHGKY